MIPCYNSTQPNKENVAICVSFAPLNFFSNSDGYFSGYTIFYHDKYRNKFFGDSVNKTDKNKDFPKGQHMHVTRCCCCKMYPLGCGKIL